MLTQRCERYHVDLDIFCVPFIYRFDWKQSPISYISVPVIVCFRSFLSQLASLNHSILFILYLTPLELAPSIPASIRCCNKTLLLSGVYHRIRFTAGAIPPSLVQYAPISNPIHDLRKCQTRCKRQLRFKVQSFGLLLTMMLNMC